MQESRFATGNSQLIIRDFQTDDQSLARELILSGLREHWGDAFAGVFLVALAGERLVGTGALIPERPGVARIARMSVAADMRRHGVGRQILQTLCSRARERGCQKIILETTSTWEGAAAFYRDFGFKVIGAWDGDTHFELQVRCT
ncbi:MAG: hypothetical protein B5M51_09575 [Anaerolinea sp. 4484_236]|nr:MAG: hypothetical protein B5M51_09575 [Anaerolinea sp. 4484_236]